MSLMLAVGYAFITLLSLLPYRRSYCFAIIVVFAFCCCHYGHYYIIITIGLATITIISYAIIFITHTFISLFHYATLISFIITTYMAIAIYTLPPIFTDVIITISFIITVIIVFHYYYCINIIIIGWLIYVIIIVVIGHCHCHIVDTHYYWLAFIAMLLTAIRHCWYNSDSHYCGYILLL